MTQGATTRAGDGGSLVRANLGKITAIVLLLGAAGAVYYFNGSSKEVLPDSLNMVCAASGKTFHMARSKVRQLPMINPDTGQATLLPFVENGGKRLVSDRYRPLLREMKEANKFIDINTLEVRAAP